MHDGAAASARAARGRTPALPHGSRRATRPPAPASAAPCRAADPSSSRSPPNRCSRTRPAATAAPPSSTVSQLRHIDPVNNAASSPTPVSKNATCVSSSIVTSTMMLPPALAGDSPAPDQQTRADDLAPDLRHRQQSVDPLADDTQPVERAQPGAGPIEQHPPAQPGQEQLPQMQRHQPGRIQAALTMSPQTAAKPLQLDPMPASTPSTATAPTSTTQRDRQPNRRSPRRLLARRVLNGHGTPALVCPHQTSA